MISSRILVSSKPFWQPSELTEAEPHEMTIVTAFFDIGRSQWSMEKKPSKFRRTTDYYIECFSRLATIRNRLVIYTQSEFAEKVLSIRRSLGLENKTVIYTIDDLFLLDPLPLLERDINVCAAKGLRRRVVNPAAPEYNVPKYVLVNFLKASFVAAAIQSSVVVTEQVAWIDFGYCRTPCFPENFLWRFDTKGKINLFHIRPMSDAPIYDICLKGEVFIQGCHILGPKNCWENFEKEIYSSLTHLLECDLVDDDQTLLLMAYRRRPQDYLLNPIDPSDWFVVFKNFNDLNKTPEVIFPVKNSLGNLFFQNRIGRSLGDAMLRLIARYWRHS